MLSGWSCQCKVKLQAENERNTTEEMILVQNFLNSHYKKAVPDALLRYWTLTNFTSGHFRVLDKPLTRLITLISFITILIFPIHSLWKRSVLLLSTCSA